MKQGKIRLHAIETETFCLIYRQAGENWGMRESLRKSGIDIIGNVPWGTHFCQFYKVKEELMDKLVPYFKAGLENNELCVWIISRPIEVEEAKEALKKSVPDIDVYLKKGQMEIIPYTHGYMKEGIFDSERFLNDWVEKFNKALESNYDGVRLSGDISWLEEEGWNRFVEYKKQIDNVINNYRIVALCTYSLARCNPIEIIDLAVNHQFALIKREGKWEQIESFRSKKAEETAFQNVKDWEQTFDALPELVTILDNEFRIIRANKAMAAKLGTTPEKCIGLTCYRTIHGLNEPPSFCPHQQLFNDGLEHTEEVQEEVLGGIFSVSVLPLHNAAGELIGCVHIARDITDRKKIEESLRESEAKYRNIIETANEGILIVDTEFRATYVNKKLAEMLEYSQEEIIGKSVWDFTDEEGKAISRLKQKNILRSAINDSIEFRLICKDGTSIWVLINTKSLFDKNGLFIGALVMVTDITKHKKMEEALRLSTIYNRSLIEASLDPLVTIGPDGKITDVNNSTETVTGRSRDELIGTDFSDYFTEPEKAREGYQQVFKYGKIWNYPLEIQHRDGHITPVLYNASVYRDELGEVVGVFAAAHDIAELKKAEEKIKILANIVEFSEDAIVTKSLDGIITSWNKGAEKVYGYSAEEVLGKNISILEPDDFKGEIKRFSEKIKKRENIQHYETSRLKKDGTIIDVSVTLSPIFDVSGELVAISTIARDITERKKAERSLRLSDIYNRSLIEANLDPLVTIGPDGKITDVNSASEKITGYSRDKLIGTDFSDYFTEPEEAKKGYHQAFINGEIRDLPLEVQHKDGRITHVLYNASVYRDETGKVIGVVAASRDITKRKKAEETLKIAYENLEKLIKERTVELEKAYNLLKESEEGLAEAQRIAHVGNWDWDLVTGKGHWSNELYNIFGRSPEKSSPSYNELFNYIHPEDREYVEKSIKKGLKEESKSGIDYRIILANGEERTVHSQAEVIFDEQKIPVRVKGIVQDITERKKTEEKIQILANIVESSNDAIGTISLDGIVTSCNKEAEQVYGYSAEEILGKHISIFAPPHLEKETSELSEMIKQGKKIHHHETSRLRKDGKIIYVSITLSPVFDSHGKLTAISFISRDITERKKAEEKLRESEEKYRNIVETANEGIFIIDSESIVTYANKKMMNMLGYTLEEVIGRTLWNFVSEESKAIIKLNQERRKQGINESYELKLICKGGSSLWVLVSAKSLFDKNGKFMGSISMLTDITKRKEAEEALANIEVARKQEIHHRIKNNLQVISSLLDLQAEKFNSKEDINDSEVMEAFRESQDRVISMALIHEELYKGGGFDTLNFSSYIGELAENLFQTYSLGNANISLSMDLEENTFFDMDIAVPLGIIVNELISNSLKHAFTKTKDGKIRIKLCREEKGSKMHKSIFSLTISDNGTGIPESMKLENLESLGLQLVSTLVDQMDGEIELKRTHGTEFRITFKATERS